MRGLSRRAGVRVFRFFRRELAAAAPAPRTELRLLELHEAVPLCGDLELDLRVDAVRAAYARGDRCVGVFDGGRVVGYCWLAFEPLPHLDGVWVAFGPAVAWTYKSLVRPSHRGRGLAADLYRHADALCRERGRTISVICVESHNQPSIAAARRAGYRAGGLAAYVARGDAVRFWTSPTAKEAGIRFRLPSRAP